jgi:predicted porin
VGRDFRGFDMMRNLMAAGCALLLFAPAAAAENQIWTSLNLKKKPSTESRYEFELNTEMRYQPDGYLDTIEIRPGVSYKLDNGMKLSGGYLYGIGRRAGPDRHEHRLWEQVSYDIAKPGDGKIEGRSKIEQRWREGADGTGWRLRQQISYERPISGTKLKLNLSDEATIGLNDTNWGHAEGLQENRAKAVVKWKTGRAGWELGYMYQYRNGVNGAPDQDNHHIIVGLSAGF